MDITYTISLCFKVRHCRALTSKEQSTVHPEDFDQQAPSCRQPINPGRVCIPALSLLLCCTIGFLDLSELVHASHVRLGQRQIPKIHTECGVPFPDDGCCVREQDSTPDSGLDFGRNVRDPRIERIRNPGCIGICRNSFSVAFLERLERLRSKDLFGGEVERRPARYNDGECKCRKQEYRLKRLENLQSPVFFGDLGRVRSDGREQITLCGQDDIQECTEPGDEQNGGQVDRSIPVRSDSFLR